LLQANYDGSAMLEELNRAAGGQEDAAQLNEDYASMGDVPTRDEE
jgi:hypothetical protein